MSESFILTLCVRFADGPSLFCGELKTRADYYKHIETANELNENTLFMFA